MKEKTIKKVLLSSTLIILLAALYIITHSLIEKVGKLNNVQKLETSTSVTKVFTDQLDGLSDMYHDGLSLIKPDVNTSDVVSTNASKIVNSNITPDINQTVTIKTKVIKQPLKKEISAIQPKKEKEIQ